MYRARLADSRATLELARSANPSDSQALQQMALLDGLLGEFPRAIAAARRALELDPKNPGSYAPLAAALQLSGQPADAAATAGAMIDAAPGAPIAYVLLARAEVARGDFGRALEAVNVAEQLGGASSPVAAIDLAVAYRRLGRAADAARLADIFAAGTQGLYVSPALRAAERLARGDDEGALREARAAFESRGLGASPLELAAFQWNVWSYPLLEEPAWRELRKAMAMHD
jgi:tetratricopeptide (TPR) repeat protein